jgi:hypothetical protein
MGNPDLEGRQVSQQMNSGETSDLANLYNMFATKSSAGQVGATPVNAAPNTQGLQAARAAAIQGAGAAANINSSASNIMGTTTPTVGNPWGELFAGISNLAQSPVGQDIYGSVSNLFRRPSSTVGNQNLPPAPQTRANRNAGFGF